MLYFEPDVTKISSSKNIIYSLPSTSEVRSVTLAALRLPAGNAKPIRSSLSRKNFPPFFDFALKLKLSLCI